ncbi:AP2-like DNA-binding integrase domain-containing protein [Cohnella sp. OV330]|uniref:tyrosine-type recombinase/integrase n=1 Tax=Cohnella sp. OV330 TaxID=1855288 RepID=UPI0008E94633|nr:site-specific integrase [Cohnella sp. OV330]SFB62745.1 AP2-like DNA-binding integrase domain-containing protein [Cohnella sp. OV330]
MRGTVTKKGKKYYIVFTVKDEDTGKWKAKWMPGGYDLKKDAQKALPDLLSALMKGTYEEPVRLDRNVEELMTEFLKDKRKQVKHGTWLAYDWLVRKHIVPHLGSMKVRKLHPDDLHALYHNTLYKELAAASIKKANVILNEALKRAPEWSIEKREKASFLKLPQGKKSKFKVWNEKQLRLFMKAAESDQYSIVFELAANTGMRQSEILGLQWDDVDLEGQTISVRQAYTKAEVGHDMDDTKNDSSERSIALFPQTVALLRRHREKQIQEMQDNQAFYQDHGLVVQTSVGTPLGPRNLARNYYAILDRIERKQTERKEAGRPFIDFKRIRFHDIRHTHATILLKRGVHPKIVQERLGHSSITVTLDTYSHVLPNLQASVLRSLGPSILGVSKKKSPKDAKNKDENPTLEKS